jgi:hypothetical protein
MTTLRNLWQNQRLNVILSALLVVQIALGAVIFWPRSAEGAGGEPFFPGLSAGDVVRITIVDSDGGRIGLQRTGDGWVLPEADDFPALEDKVSSTLEQLLDVGTGRLVTRTPASHDQLQVAIDNYAMRVEFEDASGETYTYYVGSSPRYGSIHVRRQDRNEVYLTSSFSSWEITTNARDWVDSLYLSLQRDEITRITLQNAFGEVVLEREPAESEADEATPANWTLLGLAEGETVSQSQVNTLLGQVATVSMVAPLGKTEEDWYNIDQPNAIATVETGDALVTIYVGAQTDDGNYVVKASTEPYYVTVASYSVERLVNDGRDAFLEAPPTPEPSGG